jgi:CBS domain-containing protein
MKIKYNIIGKEQVIYCKESFTVKEALNVLEKSGYRCIPVLSENGTLYRGNIYAQVVYRALWRKEVSEDDPVMKLIEDSDVHIQETGSFFRIFSNIKQYPYLAVTDDKGAFTGILTHANVMEILEDSWGIKRGNYTMTISTHEYQGALSAIMTSVKKYSTIHSMMTLDNESTFFRRVIVTLPKETSEKTLDKLIRHLEADGFRVFDIEKI